METKKCKICKEIKPVMEMRLYDTNGPEGTCRKCATTIEDVIMAFLRGSKIRFER